MDPGLVAIIALIASALQVAILRAIDYYWPRGHTAIGDREARRKKDREKGGEHEQHPE